MNNDNQFGPLRLFWLGGKRLDRMKNNFWIYQMSLFSLFRVEHLQPRKESLSFRNVVSLKSHATRDFTIYMMDLFVLAWRRREFCFCFCFLFLFYVCFILRIRYNPGICVYLVHDLGGWFLVSGFVLPALRLGVLFSSMESLVREWLDSCLFRAHTYIPLPPFIHM